MISKASIYGRAVKKYVIGFFDIKGRNLSNIICIFLKYVWVKKYIKIYIILFKN